MKHITPRPARYLGTRHIMNRPRREPQQAIAYHDLLLVIAHPAIHQAQQDRPLNGGPVPAFGTGNDWATARRVDLGQGSVGVDWRDAGRSTDGPVEEGVAGRRE